MDYRYDNGVVNDWGMFYSNEIFGDNCRDISDGGRK